MHGLSLCARVIVLLVAVGAAGCLPTRGDVSPDGRTFYFSMMVPSMLVPGEKNKVGSPILALDAETGRLAALTDSVGVNFWCCLSPDGKYLTYMGPAIGAVSIMDLEKGEAVPLTGILEGYGYPRMIQVGDGEKVFGLLAKTTRGLGSPGGEAKDNHWVVMSLNGAVPLPDLEGYEASQGEAVTIPGGVLAVPVHRLTNVAEADKGQPKKYESAVILLSVGEYLKTFKDDAAKPAAPPAPLKGIVLAKWTSEGDPAPVIDLALSSDREDGRLVAAVSGQGPGKDITQFFELFPPEKGATRLLFEAAKAGRPQWTPDGQALVYLRANTANPAWADVVLWRPEQKEPLVLAHLPGMKASDDPEGETTTAWRWLPNGRLRIFNVSKDGLRQIETAADGTGAKARLLRADRLNLQVGLALADQAKHAPQPLEKLRLDGLMEKAKPSLEAVAAAAKALDAAHKNLWPLATEWEDVPAMPEVPPPPPKPAAEKPPAFGPPQPETWEPVAALTDEFDAAKLDEAKWWPTNPSWIGRKPGLFRESNVTVSGGKLHITMRKETVAGAPPGYHTFTCGAVKSKATVLYGFFEVKAKAMNSRGSSAFWFYNSTPTWWTEIDVFEIGGGAPEHKRKVHMNAHVFVTPEDGTKHWNKGGDWDAPFDLAADYHVYALDWSEKELKYYVDGVVRRTMENTHWRQPLHLNFDSETMPEWFGLPDEGTLPSTFSVEYVRAWKKKGALEGK